jgi:hypothetical protein
VPNPNEPISLTRAEIKLLEALIELEEEEREGSAQSVTVFDSPDELAIWVKAGKWVWKNRYKLLAATQAVTDLVGGVVEREGGAGGELPLEMRVRLSDISETTLDELIAARDQVHRALESQKDTGSKQ